MKILLNPIHSGQWLTLLSLLLVGGSAALSSARLKTVATETQNGTIASYRAQSCRVLPPDETVVLGGYYFQPSSIQDGRLSGSLLSEGVYICDRYGNSARIERGGYAQYVTTATDIPGINKELEKRLKDPRSPDSSEATQVRRARNLGLYQPPKASDQPEQQFFKIQEDTPHDPNAEG